MGMFQKLFLPLARIAGSMALVVMTSLAQVEQGTVTGIVTDPSNAAIVDAKITLTNADTRVAAVTTTNQQGVYNFPFTAPGRYEITAEKTGFSIARVTNITITVGQAATINVSLTTGSVKQEISVSATAVQLDEQSSSLGNVVSSQQIVQLPLNGRNP